jgi:hypothetical protein
MAKGTKSSSGSRLVRRDAGSGEFTVGRKSFASISSVEGIELSRTMDGEFRRTKGMTPDQRRSTLASKYGKKK